MLIYFFEYSFFTARFFRKSLQIITFCFGHIWPPSWWHGLKESSAMDVSVSRQSELHWSEVTATLEQLGSRPFRHHRTVSFVLHRICFFELQLSFKAPASTKRLCLTQGVLSWSELAFNLHKDLCTSHFFSTSASQRPQSLRSGSSVSTFLKHCKVYPGHLIHVCCPGQLFVQVAAGR